MSTGRWFNGLVFITLGILLLLMNFGLVGWDFWWYLGKLWPVLLIALGLKMVFSRSAVATVLVLLVFAATLGYAAWQGETTGGSGKTGTADFAAVLNSGVTRGECQLNFGAGELRVSEGSAGFATGSLDYYSVRPEWKYTESGDRGSLRVTQAGSFPVNIGGWPHNQIHRWSVQLSDQVVWDIEANTGACQAVLDLTDLPVEQVTVKTGASEVYLLLGVKHPLCRVKVQAGASGINLTFPRGAGVRIDYDSALSGNNLTAAGFIREDDDYLSPGYDSAGVVFEVEVDTGVGNLQVNFS